VDELVLYSHYLLSWNQLITWRITFRVGRGRGRCVACINFCKKTLVTLHSFLCIKQSGFVLYILISLSLSSASTTGQAATSSSTSHQWNNHSKSVSRCSRTTQQAFTIFNHLFFFDLHASLLLVGKFTSKFVTTRATHTTVRIRITFLMIPIFAAAATAA